MQLVVVPLVTVSKAPGVFDKRVFAVAAVMLLDTI
jgi:hypothetical protein